MNFPVNSNIIAQCNPALLQKEITQALFLKHWQTIEKVELHQLLKRHKQTVQE
jgi:hypothetical protein